MSFECEKDRMLRILEACNAPTEVRDQLNDRCQHLDEDRVDAAEALFKEFFDICKQHNFTAPWEDGGEVEFYFGHNNPTRSEQSFRNGYYQGMRRVLDDLANSVSMRDVKSFAAKIDAWRQEPVQCKGASLGHLRPTGLPSKWDNI